MLRKVYIALRIGGYVGGLLGLILFTLGRRSEIPKPEIVSAGGVLILLGFLAFFASYVIYVATRLRGRAR